MARSELQALQRPKQVPVEDVARELVALWHQADASGNPDETLVRACGLTAVGITADPRGLGGLCESLGAATMVVPARTLLVALADEVEGGLRAEVSAFCAVGAPGGPQVCQEQVLLYAQRDRAGDLPSLIAPLLIGDLPAVVLVPDPRLVGSSLVMHLLRSIDLLIADSQSADDAAGVLRRLCEIDAHPRLVVRDLAFERLIGWREAVANAYDEVVARGARLLEVEAVFPGQSAEGDLLLGWIHSRLPADRRPRLRRTSSAGQERVLSLTLGKDGEEPTTIRLEGFGRIVARVSACDDAPACDLPRPIPPDGEILARMLADPGEDPVYGAALAAAAARAWET